MNLIIRNGIIDALDEAYLAVTESENGTKLENKFSVTVVRPFIQCETERECLAPLWFYYCRDLVATRD